MSRKQKHCVEKDRGLKPKVKLHGLVKQIQAAAAGVVTPGNLSHGQTSGIAQEISILKL